MRNEVLIMNNKYSREDRAVAIGAVLAALVCGGTAYGIILLLMEKLANELSALLNAIIAIM